MNKELFQLRPLAPFRLPDGIVDRAITRLAKIVENMPDGPSVGEMDHVEELRNRLKKAAKTGQTFEEATQVPRREHWLILLYTLDLGSDGAQKWLPPIDDQVARSILGNKGTEWHPARRRDVTQLFFTQFDRLEAVSLVGKMLRQSWGPDADGVFDEAALKWGAEATTLFWEDGPERLAKKWMRGESAADLADRCFIHQDSRFRERLTEAVLLGRLAKLRFGSDDDGLFALMEKDKEASAGGGRLLGSRAVEIMVQSALDSQNAAWADHWTKALVLLACDPRIPNLAERQRWWGWADERALREARNALLKRNLEKFIQYLGESLNSRDDRDKFDRRKGFLLSDLLGQHRVEDVQLLIQEDSHRRLDADDRMMPSITKMMGKINGREISLIVLKCTDGITIVEGTHTYGIRCFMGNTTPVDWVWKRRKSCHVSEISLGIGRGADHFYQAHTGDVWIDGFYTKLNMRIARPWRRA
jgi:hypothetical protein